MYFTGKSVYFVGIGGIGMSALAQILQGRGVQVQGSDMQMSEQVVGLRRYSIKVAVGQEASAMPVGVDIIVYSTAVEPDNMELLEGQRRGVEIMTYAEALGRFTADFELVAVVGTHGKTTTTAMLAKLLVAGGLDPTVVIGGKIADLGEVGDDERVNFRIGKSELMLVEACEYRAAFLAYYPQILVVTNIDVDHLDYFGSIENYRTVFDSLLANVRTGGTVVYNQDDQYCRILAQKAQKRGLRVLGVNLVAQNGADYTLNIGQQSVTLPSTKGIKGKYNFMNAGLALAASVVLGLDMFKSVVILGDFQGLWRRMEYRGEYRGARVYDDYAHHPVEIAAVLTAMHDDILCRSGKLFCVFQPHQLARTQDFLTEFGRSLAVADVVILLDIYQARGASSYEDGVKLVQHIMTDIQEQKVVAVYGRDFAGVQEYLEQNIVAGDVLMILGAGDVVDLTALLLKNS